MEPLLSFQFTLQAEQKIKQEPKVCEWCGKFVVLVSARFPVERSVRKEYDFYLDESGRLVRDENELFLISSEHKCKVTCSGCGKLVIIDKGRLYERASKPIDLAPEIGQPHAC
jgi:hypothetical protein